MKGLSLSFTKRNFFFLGVCLGGLIFIVLVSILPLIAQKHELSSQAPLVKNEQKMQKQIADILTTIDKKLKEIEKLESLPKVSYESLRITESSNVTNEIKDLAINEQLEVVNIKAIMPDSSINLKNISFLSTVKGSLENIRSYLFSLLQVPYIGNIEKIEIQTGDNVLIMDLIFTVRLS